MADGGNRILARMLDRLFASMVNGPSLNCRPHASRQRIDLSALSRLRDKAPEAALRELLGEARETRITARVAPPGNKGDDPQRPDPEQEAWTDQQAILAKLRVIAEDARTYEQDTGVAVLNIGFPLLSMPPGTFAAHQGPATRRIIAPIAFIPVTLTLRAGASQSVQIACRGDGADLVTPNTALLAWLEQQTGQPTSDLFADELGEEPWREICEVVRRTAHLLELPVPDLFTRMPPDLPASIPLVGTPRTEELDAGPAILPAGVLGLFPMSNQGLLRDMQAMNAGQDIQGPVESFIRADVNLDAPPPAPGRPEPAPRRSTRILEDERFVTLADPCQSRAVKLARTCRGLVIHGPPGTGKSQTITNIIGDHLARGQRVLLVCDKRTALDVVVNRMEHLGLGGLCALVHDPRRDQRELYRMIRDQLEALTEATTNDKAEAQLEKADGELQRLHDELTRHWNALMTPNGASFHDMVGQWLALQASTAAKLDDGLLAGASLADLEKHAHDLDDALQRGLEIGYAANPWVAAAGITLADFLARPMPRIRSASAAIAQAAADADATLDSRIPPFAADVELTRQGAARLELADRLAEALAGADAGIAARWAARDQHAVERAHQKITEAQPSMAILRAGPLDGELLLSIQTAMPTAAQIGRDLLALDAYISIADRWYAFLCFKRRSAAAPVAARYGLPLTPGSARRLRTFLVALRARLVLIALYNELLDYTPMPTLVPDEALDRALSSTALAVALLHRAASDPATRPVLDHLRDALANAAGRQDVLHGLRASPARAAAVARLEQSFRQSGLFDAGWLEEQTASIRSGEPALPLAGSLRDRVDALDSLLRLRQTLAGLPAPLREASARLLEQGAAPAEAMRLLRRAVLANEISGRLRDDPTLQSLDAQRLKSSFTRYRNLDKDRKQLVCDAIRHKWISRQKERLLANSGSRLNGLGADLRRRLTLRGEKAMRLRQVIAVGQNIEGGDPLFDVCPVWMASPETVAQVFPRAALFDVVIFDEASQCRLEEALPVLLRGRRVVIAGDPRQLPPTRFFESAVASSDDDEVETDQQLFELQQGEVEDLLAAALNLSIDQSYLDVHYRSRNADLIEFSNEHFYGSRLQAIPAHPSSRSRTPPITLYRVDGTYDKRENPAEADRVVQIVRELLDQARPPSIGIACFNLSQRDLILERLDDLAAEDATFADRLAEARRRTGEASFEGLFVKNLENVQGDERDHIIISTTYGPDPRGRFYKRFGPLGRAGGGRRLNVLITRARQHVHVVTSIPPEAYRSLPPVPDGQTPGGGWLLFAYLAYVEQLADTCRQADTRVISSGPSRPEVRERPSRHPSAFARALAQSLAQEHQIGSDVHWGNDGFCVDLALRDPENPDTVTLGVLCDGTRYVAADDPIEWDIFRTAVHESQGWKLHRVWTPQFFRDPQAALAGILKQAGKLR